MTGHPPKMISPAKRYSIPVKIISGTVGGRLAGK
jgi:hypothetical protein